MGGVCAGEPIWDTYVGCLQVTVRMAICIPVCAPRATLGYVERGRARMAMCIPVCAPRLGSGMCRTQPRNFLGVAMLVMGLPAGAWCLAGFGAGLARRAPRVPAVAGLAVLGAAAAAGAGVVMQVCARMAICIPVCAPHATRCTCRVRPCAHGDMHSRMLAGGRFERGRGCVSTSLPPTPP